MRTVYVFGNEYLEYDEMAKRVGEHLKDVKIIHCRSPDELLECRDEELLILDVATGINEPHIITDTAKLKTRNLLSLHDFDLGYFLNLLEELGTPKRVKIIALPQGGDPKLLARQVQPWIKQLQASV